MALTLERRGSPRTTPAAGRADVLIMEADEKWMMPAKLLNMSADGGLISPATLVSTGHRICLLFERLPQAGWVDAEVVRGAGPSQVGIRFLAQMSPEFIQV